MKSYIPVVLAYLAATSTAMPLNAAKRSPQDSLAMQQSGMSTGYGYGYSYDSDHGSDDAMMSGDEHGYDIGQHEDQGPTDSGEHGYGENETSDHNYDAGGVAMNSEGGDSGLQSTTAWDFSGGSDLSDGSNVMQQPPQTSGPPSTPYQTPSAWAEGGARNGNNGMQQPQQSYVPPSPSQTPSALPEGGEMSGGSDVMQHAPQDVGPPSTSDSGYSIGGELGSPDGGAPADGYSIGAAMGSPTDGYSIGGGAPVSTPQAGLSVPSEADASYGGSWYR